MKLHFLHSLHTTLFPRDQPHRKLHMRLRMTERPIAVQWLDWLEHLQCCYDFRWQPSRSHGIPWASFWTRDDEDTTVDKLSEPFTQHTCVADQQGSAREVGRQLHLRMGHGQLPPEYRFCDAADGELWSSRTIRDFLGIRISESIWDRTFIILRNAQFSSLSSDKISLHLPQGLQHLRH